jgi:hypothetical protein
MRPLGSLLKFDYKHIRPAAFAVIRIIRVSAHGIHGPRYGSVDRCFARPRRPPRVKCTRSTSLGGKFVVTSVKDNRSRRVLMVRPPGRVIGRAQSPSPITVEQRKLAILRNVSDRNLAEGLDICLWVGTLPAAMMMLTASWLFQSSFRRLWRTESPAFLLSEHTNRSRRFRPARRASVVSRKALPYRAVFSDAEDRRRRFMKSKMALGEFAC